MMLYFVVESLAADAEDSGGFGLVPIHRIEHLCQVLRKSLAGAPMSRTISGLLYTLITSTD